MIKKISKIVKSLSKKKKIIYGVGALGTIAIVTIAIAVPISIGNKNKKSNESSKTTDSSKLAPALKWPANTKNANLWKVGEEYFSTKAKALNKVGYSEVDSGFYKDNKYEESIVDIEHAAVADSSDIPNSGTITVDGKEYLYYNNKSGGDLSTPAWFKSDESVNSADKIPVETIPAKVYQDKNSDKYYDTEDRAINVAGFKQGTDPKSGATEITVDGKTYNQKTGTDAPSYNSGTSAWKNGNEYGKPDFSNAENGWTIQIKGRTYYKIKTPKVFEVKKGWYPSSAILNGNEDPGDLVDGAKVINDFIKIGIPVTFPYQYVAKTKKPKPRLYEIKEGWYNTNFIADGTKDPLHYHVTDQVVLDFYKDKYLKSQLYKAPTLFPSDVPYKYVQDTIPGKNKVFEVKKGWYPSSAIVDGTKDPGSVLSWKQLFENASHHHNNNKESWDIPDDLWINWGDWIDHYRSNNRSNKLPKNFKDKYQYVQDTIPGKNKVFEVKKGWYPSSAIVDGTVAPGSLATDAKVINALKKSEKRKYYQYVENEISARNTSYQVLKGWYEKWVRIDGTVWLFNSLLPNSKVLDAISNNIPSGFKYKYVSYDEAKTGKNAQDKWNTQSDGFGIDQTNDEINNLINSITQNNEQIVINNGTSDTTWTYKAQGDSEASGYTAGSPGWYDDADSKLDQNALSNYYTHESGANADVIFKTKQDIVKEISISNLDDNQTKTSITINTSDLRDVVWNWRTTYDGKVLSGDNKGFYALQPQDDNGKNKFDTSKIKYKYLEEFFVDIGSLEGKVKSKGWTKVTLGYKKDDGNTYAINLVEIGINSNQKLPTPTHKGQTIKIDGKVVVAK